MSIEINRLHQAFSRDGFWGKLAVMEITHTALPNHRFRYEVTLTEAEVKTFFDQAVKRLAKGVKISGFRPGKAPEHLLRQQLGAETLREEAYSLAVSDAWHQIVQSLKTLPIEDPQVEVLEFAETKPGKLAFAFDTRPEVTVKNWQKIGLKKAKLNPVTEADVTKVLESLSKGHAQTIIKLDKAKKGDRVDITFEGSLKGVRKDKLSAVKFPVILGEATVMPGFEEQLQGVKKGSQKTFAVTFPANHPDPELAGQSVDFMVTVEDVYEVILPKLDDAFGKKFGHDNLKQLQAAIKTELVRERESEYEQARKAEWLAEFQECVKVDLPESLIKAEVDRSKNAWEQFLAERNIKPEQWLERQKTTLAQMEKDWHKAAQGSVKIGLGLAELAKEQGKELKTNEEFQGFLDELIAKNK